MEGPEQESFIDRECAGRPEVAARVRQLLAVSSATLPPTEDFTDHALGVDRVPERIGKFDVTATLGRGGMGTVVRGERGDGLFNQVVAIKLLRSDLSSERARHHFDAERRLLARLDHPGIARILDGGEEEGRPYLVMEFVDGRPLLDSLDDDEADIGTRLHAFLEAADAISAAHRSLVVHGDLKPANVFRTADGRVKLLDFGIGRLLDELGEAPGSALGPHPMTPRYAPPERLAGQPPSVAGDVWGMGVLLREMLPEPALRPKGDLHAMVAKATAEEPAKRYPDVAALASDVRRHLANEPISARPHGFLYVADRFVRRNRLPVGLAASALLLLIIAAVVSFLLYLDAREQRASAEARFEEVRSIAKFQLFTLYPQLAALPGTLEARVRLAAESQAYLDRLAMLEGAPDAVRLETASGLIRLAEIQGVPNRANIGEVERARANLARAEAMLAPMLEQSPGDKTIARELAWMRLYQADLAVWQDSRAAEGERLLQAAEALVEQAGEESPAWRQLETFRRGVRLDVLGWSERYAEEIAFAAETLEWLGNLPVTERETPSAVISRAEAHNARAEGIYYTQGGRASLEDARMADGLLAAALTRHPDHPQLLSARVVSLYNLLTTLDAFASNAELLPMAEEMSRLARRSRVYEPNDRLTTWRARNADAVLAQFLGEAGRHDEALTVQQGIVALDRVRLSRAAGDTRVARDLGFSSQLLGTLKWEAGNRAEACRLWNESDRIFTGLEGRETLNEWDRSNVVAPMRHNVRICRGELPPSAYRKPD